MLHLELDGDELDHAVVGQAEQAEAPATIIVTTQCIGYIMEKQCKSSQYNTMHRNATKGGGEHDLLVHTHKRKITGHLNS